MTEISGVDAPAHDEPGWMVLKSRSLPQESGMPEPINLEALDPEVADVIKSLTDQVESLQKSLDEAAAPAEVEPTTEEEAFAKALDTLPEPLRKAFADTQARALKAEADANAERDRRLTEEYVAKAAELSNLSVDPATFGPVLKSVAEVTAENALVIFDVLKAANASLAAGEIFVEKGASVPAAGGTAAEQMEALAKSRSTEKSIPFASAMSEVASENPALYTQHLIESRKGA